MITIAAISEPQSLVPPLIWESVGRDIAEQIYERLAVLPGGAAPMDEAAYQAALATRWERLDSLRWRFTLRADARWQDGIPVTAQDVVFSFGAFQDNILDAPARPSLHGMTVTAGSDSTVEVRFPRAYAEQLYDATWHVRIFPRHIWEDTPREAWAADTAIAHLIGSGPYRLVRWDRGQSLTLERTDTGGSGPSRVVWRFSGAPDAAANLVLSGGADVLETVPDPARMPEFSEDSSLTLVPYPSAVYGFLGFNLATAGPLRDPRVRRALAMAIDRPALAEAVFGPGTRVPAGPMSAMLWLWREDSAAADPSAAATALDAAGYRLDRMGSRHLAFDILVPATSTTRRNLAIALQERWRRLGVEVGVTAVDFPVFQERLAKGQFAVFIGAWLDEPSPRNLADQWSRSGWGAQNYGHYHNPAFEHALQRTVDAVDTAAARLAWDEALGILAEDQPAIFLYTLVNTAVVSNRVSGVVPDAYSWARGLVTWEVAGRK
ncbi:MAG TPA: ABC transporter substrate-binding protein [Gemmatimonadales bacterium]